MAFADAGFAKAGDMEDGKATDRGAVINEDTQQHSWACRSSVAGLPARRTRRGQSERTDFSPGRLRRGNHQGAGKTESSTLSGRSLDYRNKNTASSTSSSTSSTGWFSLRRDEGQSRPESDGKTHASKLGGLRVRLVPRQAHEEDSNGLGVPARRGVWPSDTRDVGGSARRESRARGDKRRPPECERTQRGQPDDGRRRRQRQHRRTAGQ